MLDLIGKISMATVRGLLTLGGFGALTYMFVYGKVPIETYVPLVALMIGFYFGTRGKNE